ncbi:MAG: PilZ domain-containing protein [Sandaracinaceae bacterium]
MRNLLEMIYEHQLLRSKERHLDIPLDDAERVKLLGLERLLMGERPDQRQRKFVRVRLPMDVQFTRPAGFETGKLRDLGGGGFQIATSRPPEPGTRIIVRVEDARRGIEYVFPCLVAWRSPRGPGRMGVKLDGVPSSGPLFGEEASDVWRRSMTLGDDRGEPLVA